VELQKLQFLKWRCLTQWTAIALGRGIAENLEQTSDISAILPEKL